MWISESLISRIFIFLAIFASCKKPSPNGHNEISLKDIIYSQTFENGDKFSSSSLKFAASKYQFELGSEGLYWYNEGSFVIDTEKVKLKPTKCLDGNRETGVQVSCKQTFNDGYCAMDRQSQNIEFELTLKCISPSLKAQGLALNELTFNIKSTLRKPGEIVEIQKSPVVFLGRRKGEVTTTANLRTEPTIKSRKQIYFPFNEKNGEFLDAVPGGTPIILLGKTVNREKVQNWENHWYLVEVGHNKDWMFGEFIKEQQP